MLRRYHVIFDYNRNKVYMSPNSMEGEPWDEERAGLTALNLGGEYVVVSVAEQSPAFRAGLALGDRIVQVDGKPASQAGITGMRLLVRQNPGATVSLTITRDGAQKDITITLEDYVK